MPQKRNGYRNGNGSVLNAGTAVNVLSIPLITVIFGFVGWYFTTGDTLRRQTQDIASLQQVRETDRKEFGQKFDAMNDSLGKLTTHAAVQDQQQSQMNDTLKQIRDVLTPQHK